MPRIDSTIQDHCSPQSTTPQFALAICVISVTLQVARLISRTARHPRFTNNSLYGWSVCFGMFGFWMVLSVYDASRKQDSQLISTAVFAFGMIILILIDLTIEGNPSVSFLLNIVQHVVYDNLDRAQ